MNVAIIPARGGSKRIPGKNVRDFCGQPIIGYSIRAALTSGLFEQVIVSTDASEIAEVARHFGADIPFVRPKELADDYATTNAVFIHALHWLDAQSQLPEFACCIYPTAPFLFPSDLTRGLNTLQETEATSAFSVTTFNFPIFRALRIGEGGRLSMFWPEHREARSQDLPEACHDAGQFYWVDTKKYLEEGQLFSKDAVPVPLPRFRVQDIDTFEDWRRAELMYAALERDGD